MKRAFTIVELLVVIAIFAILLALTVSGVSMVRDAGRKVQCASQLRQFGVAFYQFAREPENNGRFPRSDWDVQFGFWIDQTQRFYRDFELLVCPSDPAPFALDALSHMSIEGPLSRDAYVGQHLSYHGSCMTLETARGRLGPRVSDYARPSRTMLLDEVTTSPGGNRCQMPEHVWDGWHSYYDQSINFDKTYDALTRHGGGVNWLMADGSAQWWSVYDAPASVSYRINGEIARSYR